MTSPREMPASFINREFSWLEFNKRVLFEADHSHNPLLERLKFLSIVTSNLEEFFMVRVAVLKKQTETGVLEKSLDGQTPQEQLKGIREKTRAILDDQYRLFYQGIIPELLKNKIEILTLEKEALSYKDYLEPIFRNEIAPLLTPLSVGSSRPFPTLVTGRIYLAVVVEALPENTFKEKTTLSFIEVPTNIYRRFLKITDKNIFIPVETIIRLFADELFSGYRVVSTSAVRISRDADISVQEDAASDLLKEIESTIKRMHRRSIVKIETEEGTPDSVLDVLVEKSRASKDDVYKINGILNLKDLMALVDRIDRDDLKDKSVSPVYPEEFRGRDPFDVIAEKDRLLYHPYHSYDVVVELVNRAADDPSVLAIKQTLYRTSPNSNIIRALIRAAEKGKYVTVIDELKARFDEQRNIEWARKLEDSGAHVTYGVAGLKTHAKALIIVRKESKSIKRYVHLSTGNYNETTAKLYTDFSLFTTDERLGEDVSAFFNLLTGFSLSDHWNLISLAPMDLRRRFLSLVKRETDNARRGLKAKITIKLNSLSDQEMIEALYEASQAGVKIRLIVRGICSLIPGLKGLSENISVYSIVGRYLEHSRIFIFHNAGDPEYYLASADWMVRNLDRRVEILFPVLQDDAKALIDQVLKLQFEDQLNTWELSPTKSYKLKDDKAKEQIRDSFTEIHEHIRKIEASKAAKSTRTIRPNRSVEE